MSETQIDLASLLAVAMIPPRTLAGHDTVVVQHRAVEGSRRMRRWRYLLLTTALLSTSCRGQQQQYAPTVMDPFLINRPTTVPPPATGTVQPLGTIQPYDPNTISVPPTGVLPPTSQPMLPGTGQPMLPSTGQSWVPSQGYPR